MESSRLFAAIPTHYHVSFNPWTTYFNVYFSERNFPHLFMLRGGFKRKFYHYFVGEQTVQIITASSFRSR